MTINAHDLIVILKRKTKGDITVIGSPLDARDNTMSSREERERKKMKFPNEMVKLLRGGVN